MSFFETTDGKRLYFKDWGTGHPVIMMHGWPLSSDTFDRLAVCLVENGFRAISYDRRGFGRSEQPAEGYHYDRLSDDLKDLIDHLALPQVALIGFSMGGGEVARYLSRHGASKVSKAILIASVVPCLLRTNDNPDGVPKEILDEIAAGLKEDRAGFYGKFFKQFYGVGLIEHPVKEETLQWTQQMAMQAGLLPTLECAKAFGSTDFRPDLPSFTVPTLVIHGTADKTVPIETSGRKAAQGIAGARLLEYDGYAHGLLESNAEHIHRDVVNFLCDPDARLRDTPPLAD